MPQAGIESVLDRRLTQTPYNRLAADGVAFFSRLSGESDAMTQSHLLLRKLSRVQDCARNQRKLPVLSPSSVEHRLSVCVPSGFVTRSIARSGENLRWAHRPLAYVPRLIQLDRCAKPLRADLPRAGNSRGCLANSRFTNHSGQVSVGAESAVASASELVWACLLVSALPLL